MAMPCLLRRAICVEWYCGTDCNATDRIRVGYAWTAWAAAMAMVCGGVVLRGWRLRLKIGVGSGGGVRVRVRGQDIASEPTLPWWPSLLLGGTGAATPDPQTEDSAAIFCTPHFHFRFHFHFITPPTVIIAAPPSTACCRLSFARTRTRSRAASRRAYRYLPIHSHPLAAVLIGR
jgi:hypothetical protein